MRAARAGESAAGAPAAAAVEGLPDEIRRLAEPGAAPRPVFIGGCSRSGTTLLGAMLGMGTQRLTVPEAEFKWDVLSRLREPGPDVDLAEALAELDRDWKFRLWECSLAAEGQGSAVRVPYAALLSALVLRHGRQVGKAAPELWIDHTPGNVRHALLLSRLFPDARFITVVRDGRAVAASVLPLDWGPNDVLEAARHWAVEVAQGLALQQRLGPERVHSISYERLVTDPETTLRGLCDFLGIPFSPAMTRTREYRVPTYSAQQHDLVARAPDPTRVSSWRTRLTPRQVETFEWVSGELLGYLGYELDHQGLARPPSKAAHLRDAAISVARRWSVNRGRRMVRRRRGGL